MYNRFEIFYSIFRYYTSISRLHIKGKKSFSTHSVNSFVFSEIQTRDLPDRKLHLTTGDSKDSNDSDFSFSFDRFFNIRVTNDRSCGFLDVTYLDLVDLVSTIL